MGQDETVEWDADEADARWDFSGFKAALVRIWRDDGTYIDLPATPGAESPGTMTIRWDSNGVATITFKEDA